MLATTVVSLSLPLPSKRGETRGSRNRAGRLRCRVRFVLRFEPIPFFDVFLPEPRVYSTSSMILRKSALHLSAFPCSIAHTIILVHLKNYWVASSFLCCFRVSSVQLSAHHHLLLAAVSFLVRTYSPAIRVRVTLRLALTFMLA